MAWGGGGALTERVSPNGLGKHRARRSPCTVSALAVVMRAIRFFLPSLLHLYHLYTFLTPFCLLLLLLFRFLPVFLFFTALFSFRALVAVDCTVRRPGGRAAIPETRRTAFLRSVTADACLSWQKNFGV